MNPTRQRVFELLASRATEGLSPPESLELERLLGDSPDLDPQCFDRAAAAVHLALLGRERPMPGALKRKLVSAGLEQLASSTRPGGPGS